MMTQARRQTVFPAPRYDDAWAAIAFLELCFGFERQTVHEGPNGTVAHGELRFGTASFGLSSANGPVSSDNPWTSVRSGVYVALQDANAVDAHHARAKAAGAVIAMPLEDTDYGSRQSLGLGRRPPSVVLRHLQPCAARRADAVRGPALSGPTGHDSLARARVWLRARAHKQRFRQVGRVHGTSSRRQCPVVEFRAARRSPMEQRLARYTPRRARR